MLESCRSVCLHIRCVIQHYVHRVIVYEKQIGSSISKGCKNFCTSLYTSHTNSDFLNKAMLAKTVTIQDSSSAAVEAQNPAYNFSLAINQ